jgi:hypothetical protein
MAQLLRLPLELREYVYEYINEPVSFLWRDPARELESVTVKSENAPVLKALVLDCGIREEYLASKTFRNFAIKIRASELDWRTPPSTTPSHNHDEIKAILEHARTLTVIGHHSFGSVLNTTITIFDLAGTMTRYIPNLHAVKIAVCYDGETLDCNVARPYQSLDYPKVPILRPAREYPGARTSVARLPLQQGIHTLGFQLIRVMRSKIEGDGLIHKRLHHKIKHIVAYCYAGSAEGTGIVLWDKKQVTEASSRYRAYQDTKHFLKQINVIITGDYAGTKNLLKKWREERGGVETFWERKDVWAVDEED